MHYIVSKLDPDPVKRTLWTTGEIACSTELQDAVNHLGSSLGDLFAVWEWDGPKHPALSEAQMVTALKAPAYVTVHGAGRSLFKLEAEAVEHVAPGRGHK